MAYNHKTKTKYRGFTPSTLLRGFTVVELLVVAPVVILLIGIFISAIMAMTGDVLSNRGQAEVLYDVRYALDIIERDVKASGAYLATNNITLTSPQGVNDDTTNFTNMESAVGSTLILNSYATTSNPLSEVRSPIYVSTPNACSSAQASQNMKLTTNIIYFTKVNSDGTYTLWRRVIMPSNYATAGCSQPWQQPSCSPGFSAPFCKVEDTRLVDGITAGGFLVKYYENADHTTISSTASSSGATNSERQAALATTAEIGVTISSTKIIAGETISQTATIKATSPNDNILSSNSLKVKVLVVAGGGGGGSSTTSTGGAGGGGGGGLIYDSRYGVVSGDAITVTVGTGGTAGTTNGGVQGANGTDSVFGTITTTGGGGGGRTTGNGNNGGSGGGAGFNSYSAARIGGTGVSGQGSSGGNTSLLTSAGGSGGGGAGGLGGPNQANHIGGSGGAGLTYSISGSPVIYAAGGSGGSNLGGPSGAASSANTGKGGDGAYDAFIAYGGGAGVVIITYPTGIITATGGTITTNGLYTIHTFTNSGTFTVS